MRPPARCVVLGEHPVVGLRAAHRAAPGERTSGQMRCAARGERAARRAGASLRGRRAATAGRFSGHYRSVRVGFGDRVPANKGRG